MNRKTRVKRMISMALAVFLMVMSNGLFFPVQTSADSNSNNLVNNPSFEDTTGWTYHSMARSSNRAYGGSYSCRATSSGAAVISDYFAVSPNTSYKLSAWVYKEGSSGSVWLDLDGAAGQPAPVASSGGQWVKISGYWFSGSYTSVRVRCLTAAGIDAAVYFDDVTLEEAYPDANLVGNPSFEDTTGWTYHSMERSSSRAHDGFYSCKATVAGAAAVSNSFTVFPNTSYKLSAWVYKEDGSGSVWLDLNGAAGDPMPTTSIGGQWVKISGDWFSGSYTSVQIRCLTAAGINAAVYFDDITLEENYPDGTFETDAGWSFGSFVRSMDMAKTGNYSLKSTTDGAASNSNSIVVSRDTTYRLSGWIYKTNDHGSAYLDLNDIQGEVQSAVLHGSGGGTWTYVSQIWNSGSNTRVKIRCVTDSGLDAAAYFDDVKLEVVAPDGTFETDAGWTYNHMSRSADKAKNGLYAVKSDMEGASVISNPFSVIPGTDYILSGWIYKTNNNGIDYLDLNDLPGEVQPAVPHGSGGGAWTYVSGIWNSGTNTQVRIRCVSGNGINAAAYFDDVKLEAVAPDGTFEGTAGWETYGAMARSSTVRRGGQYSLSSTVNGAKATSNAIPVTPNTIYTLSGWIYKTNDSGSAFLDLNGAISPGVYSGVGAGRWTRVSRDWFSGDNTYVKISCVTKDGINAAVYFDDISFSQAGPLVSPNATIATPNFAAEDVVVKDFDVTDTAFGADKTGVTDSTFAIQKALDNCSLQGGGTVWMPAGTYKVSNTIYVPGGVFLRGDWRDPDSGSGSYGTVIEANVREGFNALFDLKWDISGLYGLTIYYPNQNAVSPIDTGWAVISDVGHNHYIKNLTLLNAYKGIKFGGGGTGGFTSCPEVTDVKGTVLYSGLEYYNGYGAGGAHDIKFDNSYWANSGQSYNAPAKSTLDAYTRAHGTAFTFGRTECYNFHHLSASQYNIGMRFNGGNMANGSAQWGANFAFVTLEKTNTALQVDSAAPGRFNVFIRSTFEGSSYSIKNNAPGHTIKVTDCTLTGPDSGTVLKYSPGTSPSSYAKQVIPKVTRAILYDVSKAPYNAPYVSSYTRPAGFPFSDATQAIQAALTDAGNAGGGVVYLPAGWYRINTHLTIPANVELRGVSSGKTGAYVSLGTWLMAYEGENTATPETDTALATINGNGSGINGINVIWPNNSFETAGALKTYPFAFRINGVDGAYVINTNFKNPYHGIDVADGSDRHHIRSVYGSYSNTFIKVGTSSEGWIEELYDMNPSPWATMDDFKMAIPWMKSNIYPAYLVGYTQTQTFIKLNGPSNEHIMSILAFGPGNLIDVYSGTADIWNVGADQSGSWCVNAVGGSVKIMNSVNTVHGTDVNTGNGIVSSYNEHYVE